MRIEIKTEKSMYVYKRRVHLINNLKLKAMLRRIKKKRKKKLFVPKVEL